MRGDVLVEAIVLVMMGVMLRVTRSAADVEQLERRLSQTLRQLMVQQLYMEESARASWDSGLVQIRRKRSGPKSYNSESYAGLSVAAIHNHANNIRTVGMGEIVAILNGVEFRTRHNDYRLSMPSTTSSDYHAVQDVPFPDVPPEVSSLASVDEQIAEMREWFKAWKDQDYSVRDYRPYFKPLLCYLEGAWTNDVDLQEPFASDRHYLEADSWVTLQDQIRFTAYTGSKNYNENFSFLPTTIMQLINGSIPVMGQWNYRLLCHPLGRDLPWSYLQPLESLSSRLMRGQDWRQYLDKRNIRFRLVGPDDGESWSLIDELMETVPGLDNYGASMVDDLFGKMKYHVLSEAPNLTPVNTAYYHRIYKVDKKDAMGNKELPRGYSDRNLFVASNTQARVAECTIDNCKDLNKGGRRCETLTQKMSYAVPMEIIYLTPLQSWNPYNIVYKGDYDSQEAQFVTAGGTRDGETKETAYNGTHSQLYFLTPDDFFSGEEVDADPADTTPPGGVFVLDANGVAHSMKSSGVRVQLPNIPGVGMPRIRWPIMPLAVEGHPAWKELEALRDLVTEMEAHLHYYQTRPPFTDDVQQAKDREGSVVKQLAVGESSAEPFGVHTHVIELSKAELDRLRDDNATLRLYTRREPGVDHVHEAVVRFLDQGNDYVMIKCDRMDACFDGHPPLLSMSNAPRK